MVVFSHQTDEASHVGGGEDLMLESEMRKRPHLNVQRFMQVAYGEKTPVVRVVTHCHDAIFVCAKLEELLGAHDRVHEQNAAILKQEHSCAHSSSVENRLHSVNSRLTARPNRR